MSIGPKIKEARKSRGLTQKQLAAMIGVSPNAVCNYETGYSSPSENIVLRIMSALKIDANYLYGDLVREVTARQQVLSPDEEKLISYYRNLNESGRQLLLSTAETFVNNLSMGKNIPNAAI